MVWALMVWVARWPCASQVRVCADAGQGTGGGVADRVVQVGWWCCYPPGPVVEVPVKACGVAVPAVG